MTNLNIECPHCGEEVEIAQQLAAPLLEAEREKISKQATDKALKKIAHETKADKELIAEQQGKLENAERRELEARKAKEAAEEAKRQSALEVQRQVDAARASITKEATLAAQREIHSLRLATEQEKSEQASKLAQAQKSELEARKATEAALESQKQAELDVQRKVDSERDQIAQQATKAARMEMQAKVTLLEQEKAQQNAKLAKAQQAEIEAIQAKSAAEQAKQEMDLTITRKVAQEAEVIRQKALTEADETNRLKSAEKDKQLDDMRKQIDELKRKGEQGSQQLQGDVQETDIVDILQKAFQKDLFERVGTGQRGADVVQTVINASGIKSGTILWESKRTSKWSNQWLPKLRKDQREKRADIAALVSVALPENHKQFDCIDGVWVSDPQSFVPLAMSLRAGIIETGHARLAIDGANSKKDLVYKYLTGQEFRQRIGGVVESYVQMHSELDTEKRSYARIWSKREKQLETLITSTAGLYGDLQGIVGTNLPQVEGLQLGGKLLLTQTPSNQPTQANGAKQ